MTSLFISGDEPTDLRCAVRSLSEVLSKNVPVYCGWTVISLGGEEGNNREEMKVNYRYVNCDAPCWSTGTGPQGY